VRVAERCGDRAPVSHHIVIKDQLQRVGDHRVGGSRRSQRIADTDPEDECRQSRKKEADEVMMSTLPTMAVAY
jgi:hypothetical protein